MIPEEDDLCDMMERLELENKAAAPLRYTPADLALKAVLDSFIHLFIYLINLFIYYGREDDDKPQVCSSVAAITYVAKLDSVQYLLSYCSIF